MPARIRVAKPEDAPGLGEVHVRAWRAAYRGIVPDAYLEALASDEREKLWADFLRIPPKGRAVLVLEQDGAIKGFAAIGPEDNLDAAPRGELYALNLDPDAWGRGYGRKLLQVAMDGLRTLRFDSAVLWVAPANARARRFAEAAGWILEGKTRTAEVHGMRVDEVRYERAL